MPMPVSGGSKSTVTAALSPPMTRLRTSMDCVARISYLPGAAMHTSSFGPGTPAGDQRDGSAHSPPMPLAHVFVQFDAATAAATSTVAFDARSVSTGESVQAAASSTPPYRIDRVRMTISAFEVLVPHELRRRHPCEMDICWSAEWKLSPLLGPGYAHALVLRHFGGAVHRLVEGGEPLYERVPRVGVFVSRGLER